MLSRLFGRRTDLDLWIDRVIGSYPTPPAGLPGFPPDSYQMQSVGHSGRAALTEAGAFYRHIGSQAPLKNARVLDFGCGWGRILRFFPFDTSDLHGVDIDPFPLAECRRTGVAGELQQIEPAGRLPYPDGAFDVVYSFSVFSHLPENLARHWAREIARVLKPNGTFVFTTLQRSFFITCQSLHRSRRNDETAKSLMAAFPDPATDLANYDAGKLVYGASGGGGMLDADIYGWASIPRRHVETEWPEFSVVDILDNPRKFKQAVFTLRKT